MLPIFDLTLLLNGFPMKEAKAELQQIISFSEEEHQSFIEEQKTKIVAFHLENNPFYKEIVGSTTLKNWNDLPI